jgi:hypothetical protein
MPNAPLDLAEKVKAKVIGQVSEVADQVCDRMLIATSAVLLKNRDGLRKAWVCSGGISFW